MSHVNFWSISKGFIFLGSNKQSAASAELCTGLLGLSLINIKVEIELLEDLFGVGILDDEMEAATVFGKDGDFTRNDVCDSRFGGQESTVALNAFEYVGSVAFRDLIPWQCRDFPVM